MLEVHGHCMAMKKTGAYMKNPDDTTKRGWAPNLKVCGCMCLVCVSARGNARGIVCWNVLENARRVVLWPGGARGPSWTCALAWFDRWACALALPSMRSGRLRSCGLKPAGACPEMPLPRLVLGPAPLRKPRSCPGVPDSVACGRRVPVQDGHPCLV